MVTCRLLSQVHWMSRKIESTDWNHFPGGTDTLESIHATVCAINTTMVATRNIFSVFLTVMTRQSLFRLFTFTWGAHALIIFNLLPQKWFRFSIVWSANHAARWGRRCYGWRRGAYNISWLTTFSPQWYAELGLCLVGNKFELWCLRIPTRESKAITLFHTIFIEHNFIAYPRESKISHWSEERWRPFASSIVSLLFLQLQALLMYKVGGKHWTQRYIVFKVCSSDRS